MYVLYDFLRLAWVIFSLYRRPCCAPFTIFVAQRKASQTPAGRSSSGSNQAGPPAAQTGLYPVPDWLLEYFLNIFHFIPSAPSSVLFHLAPSVLGGGVFPFLYLTFTNSSLHLRKRAGVCRSQFTYFHFFSLQKIFRTGILHYPVCIAQW